MVSGGLGWDWIWEAELTCSNADIVMTHRKKNGAMRISEILSEFFFQKGASITVETSSDEEVPVVSSALICERHHVVSTRRGSDRFAADYEESRFSELLPVLPLPVLTLSAKLGHNSIVGPRRTFPRNGVVIRRILVRFGGG